MLFLVQKEGDIVNERIKELRLTLGLTQQAFADKLKTSRSNIANYEVCKNSPSDAVISLICEKFDVNEDWLRNGVGEMFKERLPQDEVASYVEDLLESDGNPFYEVIIGMMKAYHEMDETSRQAALEFLRRLKENLEK